MKLEINFKKNSGSSYRASLKNKWLDFICSHMVETRKPKNYWTIERCKEEALKYKNNKAFRNGSSGAYQAAEKNGWIYKINGHFTLLGNSSKRFIYAFEFPNNHVYVGLTYSFEERNKVHYTRGTIFNYIQQTGLEPIFRELILEPVSVEEAKILEEFYLQSYIDKGWVKLNKAKTGSIGLCKVKWTYEACKEEALKYSSRKAFQKGNGSAYKVTIKNNWLEEFCKHMIKLNKISGHWKNKENVIQEALKYNTKKEFSKGSSGAYNAAKKYGWVEQVCLHMKVLQLPKNYWTFEKCIEMANTCTTMSEISSKYGTAYNLILKNKWVIYLSENLQLRANPRGLYTLEICIELAKDCRTLREYKLKALNAYATIHRKGWVDLIKENFKI